MTTVCITGITGYIASHIAAQLLAQGFIVRGTVRSVSDKKKYDFLVKTAKSLGAEDRLIFVEADLLRENSFDAAFEGCKYVFHTASPFITGKVKNPQKMLIEPAVKGTENVLGSVAKCPTVERVVLTSSVAAIYGDVDALGRGHIFSEKDWNESSTLNNDAYSLSKKLAEQRAWEIADAQSTYSLVTINPGFVMGPSLSGRDDSASVNFLKGMLTGKLKKGVPAMEYGIVDVRDVAAAHIAAATNPAAKGRYLCSKEVVSLLGMADQLRATGKYKKYPMPKKTFSKALMYMVGPMLAGFSWHFIRHNIGQTLQLDNSKIRAELGILFERTLQTTLDDMAESLMAASLVPRRFSILV